ncbi:MAG: YjhX family toxin [Proteobacteria bacterium]|nr:YjhX family toxin [Pseudomonadota bacterium]
MNISKAERRALDMLSMGGRIMLERDSRNRPVAAGFISREGWFLEGPGLREFQSLRAKRLIVSRDGGDYAISRDGARSLQKSRQAARRSGAG